MSTLTIEDVIHNYQQLQSSDPLINKQANHFLMSIVDREEIWTKMITEVKQPHFKLLGAHILYQKIDRDLHQLSHEFKANLKSYLFVQMGEIDGSQIAIIDKLASSLSLIGCSVFLTDWPNMLNDILEFMKFSQGNLIKGAIFLQRIAEELKMTNRISFGAKNAIQTEFQKSHNLLAEIFQSLFEVNQNQLTKRCVITIESWIKIGFQIMNYTKLVEAILALSLVDEEKLELCSKIIGMSLKTTSQLKFQTLSEIDPSTQKQAYTQTELQSLSYIVIYLQNNWTNFVNQGDPDYLRHFISVVKEAILSFGFLLFQSIGNQLLDMVLQVTKSSYKLSSSTFQFWMDFIDKLSRLKLSQEIRQKVFKIVQTLYEIILEKTKLKSDSMLNEVDVKDDETDDGDDRGISFSQYRKEAMIILKEIYDYYVKVSAQYGSLAYFAKLTHIIQSQSDSPLGHQRNIELSLYAVKSAIESMVHEYQTNNIIEFLVFILKEHNKVSGDRCVRVVAETMNLIRDCTKQIKQNQQLLMECLSFVLSYIDDQLLCHHGAYCFRVLMQDAKLIEDHSLAQKLIDFYRKRTFNKQIIMQKILQGIFSAITKVKDHQKMQYYLSQIINQITTKSSQNISLSHHPNYSNNIYLNLIQIKILLQSYDTADKQFKDTFRVGFVTLAQQGIDIVATLLPIVLQQRVKYSNISQLGICVRIFRLALKVCGQPNEMKNWNFMQVLRVMMEVLTPTLITEYYMLLAFLQECMLEFAGSSSNELNAWLVQQMPGLNHFFLGYFDSCKLNLIDPDIVKYYYGVQQSLLLYNSEIFLSMNDSKQILQIAVYCLRHVNQKNLQKRVINFIYLCVQMRTVFQSMFQGILENAFASIPIVNTLCYNTMSRIFMIIFENSPIDKKQVFYKLLMNEPYRDIDQQLRRLFAELLDFVMEAKVERYIKGTFIDITEVAWKKTSFDFSFQVELRLKTWQKDFKKSKQAGNN